MYHAIIHIAMVAFNMQTKYCTIMRIKLYEIANIASNTFDKTSKRHSMTYACILGHKIILFGVPVET
jgi:hypothetical protein